MNKPSKIQQKCLRICEKFFDSLFSNVTIRLLGFYYPYLKITQKHTIFPSSKILRVAFVTLIALERGEGKRRF